MNCQELQSAIESGQPFIVRTVDGKEHPVPQRDYIGLSPNKKVAVIFKNSGGFCIVDVDSIVSVQKS